MGAVIVMSNGNAYHTTQAVADEVLRLTAEQASVATTTTFIDLRSRKQVTIMLAQVSSVVHDGAE